MGGQNQKYKLVLFDMDGTLINGRSIFIFSEKLGFKDKLLTTLQSNKQPYERSIEIARYLKGIRGDELLDIFRTIPLSDHVEKVTQKLKEQKLTTAIVTDSYQFIADDLKKRLNFEYAFANTLIIKNNIVSGEIQLNNDELRSCETGITYSICKENILDHLCTTLNIAPSEVIAIGDGLVDIGMIQKAGLGIAYHASEQVQHHADVITNDLSTILEYL